MRAWTMVARMLRCERGNAALVSAAALPLLLSSAALAYDTVQLAIWMQQLQEVTDASATAGAQALAGGRPVEAAIEHAIESDPSGPDRVAGTGRGRLQKGLARSPGRADFAAIADLPRRAHDRTADPIGPCHGDRRSRRRRRCPGAVAALIPWFPQGMANVLLGISSKGRETNPNL